MHPPNIHIIDRAIYLFLNLKSLTVLDLSHNKINNISNLNLNRNLSRGRIDLSHNNISTVNDILLNQFGVFSYFEFKSFVKNYIKFFDLSYNPILCDCSRSKNLTLYAAKLLEENSSLETSPLYQSTCNQPIKYNFKPAILFDDCSKSGSVMVHAKVLALFIVNKLVVVYLV